MEDITKDILNKIKEDENVSHPSHYTWLKDKCNIEVIDITRHLNFNLGNSIKYIIRSGKKPIIDKDLSDDFNNKNINVNTNDDSINDIKPIDISTIEGD